MAVSLTKGGNVSLSKLAPGLTNITIGLGWDRRLTDGKDFDLDASAFMVTAQGQVSSDQDFVFFNNPKSACGSVNYGGDNRTGDGAGDDETISVDLVNVPLHIEKIVVCVTIYEAESRFQNFGMVSNAYIRVLNLADNNEIARYDLTEDSSVETAMVFGEVYRHGGEWKFRAIGQGYSGGLRAMALTYGVNV